MSTLQENIDEVAASVESNGETSTRLQAAKTWLEEEAQKWGETFGEDAGIVGRLQAAVASAEECQQAVGQTGAALEAFQEALQACGE
jgi:hypothetical protein